ncbi:PEPxxWA-CTERM sorting domain-containing protein [uncultured Sphingomonas sp.]|uniref:PEPxxWA-CTERM sorting domain-containing protein n=1 Tax=uncultured Sphingomonas sp. TaxID=158754 RepID=UPI0035CACFAB
MKNPIRIIALAGVVAFAAPAAAERVIINVGADLSASPFTFSVMGGSFTLGATGDPFNVLTVQTGAPGEVSSFFGEPSSSFVDRGPVIYGPDFGMFAAYPTSTVVRFTNGDNFLGFRTTVSGLNYYGYAYTTNARLNSYGFETVAGREVTATVEQAVAAVPEPGTWALMVLGFGAVGYAMRRRRARVVLPSPAFAGEGGRA